MITENQSPKLTRDEINDYRKWNLRQLVNSQGGVNETARKMGYHSTYISSMLGEGKTNRGIGRVWVKRIEKFFNLEPGALDRPPPPETKANDIHIAEIASTLANASPREKGLVAEFAKTLVRYNRRLIDISKDD